MKFSDRVGLTMPKNRVQTNEIDNDLKNSLWNAVHKHINEPFLAQSYSHRRFIKDLWVFLKWHIDEIPSSQRAVSKMKEYFFSADYINIYNLLDFFVQIDISEYDYYEKIPYNQDVLAIELNKILKQELSAYRFVDRQLCPISNEIEINEIEKAIKYTDANKLRGANEHIKMALIKISDKQNPDYRNSIKESISAIEAMCQIIVNNPNAELGQAIKILKQKISIHDALAKGFSNIYGYTSNGDGIRHALTEESTLDQEDALYMLVSCSAFVNYLIVKSEKAGISLK